MADETKQDEQNTGGAADAAEKDGLHINRGGGNKYDARILYIL